MSARRRRVDAGQPHVVLVIGCATFGRETIEVTDMNTWVLEVDVATGASRTIEHLIGGFPSEAYPTVSPDGRTVVYGVGMESDDETSLGGIRASISGPARHATRLISTSRTATRGGTTPRSWRGTSPGRRRRTTTSSSTPASGTTSPLGISSLFGVSGYVGGRLAVERTPWLDRTPPCAVTYCLADPESLAISPWLELPENSQARSAQPCAWAAGLIRTHPRHRARERPGPRRDRAVSAWIRSARRPSTPTAPASRTWPARRACTWEAAAPSRPCGPRAPRR